MDEIRENPYLQYYPGYPGYSYTVPFDPRMMTWLRERVTPEMLAGANDYIIGRKTKCTRDEELPSALACGEPQGRSEEKHEGKLILNATCCPKNIRFPTDVSLLNECSELLEKMNSTAHET